MALRLVIDEKPLSLSVVNDYAFRRRVFDGIDLSDGCLQRVKKSEQILLNLLEKNIAIYGVTTGYGDSCHRVISKDKSSQLQHNLISYLRCGTGAKLSIEATRAMVLIRLKSLSRGYSGVSPMLLETIVTLLQHDILPVVPCEGSLGASGDLIPLAYLAATITGQGKVQTGDGQTLDAASALKRIGLKPYALQPKEGLALVNGTSAMAGVAVTNLADVSYLTDLSILATSWLCMALKGKVEAFGTLVNESAKSQNGQTRCAGLITALLEKESYGGPPPATISESTRLTEGYVQDRYSLRCAPQILGPIIDTIGIGMDWLSSEINSTSDNPLIDPDTGELANGGNFYGGYLAHSMDYLKICMGHLADLTDRQLMLIIDDKSNRGLPPNLAPWSHHNDDEKHLHHGLKGLHQAVNAIASEVLAMAGPSSTFSRSSELHNQDKVSLGMSAAMSLHDQIEKVYTIMTLTMVCFAQALDLRGVKLRGNESLAVYELIRNTVPYVDHDQALDEQILSLRAKFKKQAATRGSVFTRSIYQGT